jgi:hypothetical protein
MIFLGTTFSASKNTLDATPSSSNNLNKIVLNQGIYDQLYGSTNPDLDDFTNIIPD